MNINIKKLNPDAILPTYGSADAAGADLCSIEEATIAPGETKLIHTGLAMAIPQGYGGFIFARSGLATKRGLAPANKVGVIDPDYRGEIKVVLLNHSKQPQTLAPGERVAQFVITPVLQPRYEEAEELSDTDRGTGGFGSTGK
jgi:dUTP pyrophosphatase